MTSDDFQITDLTGESTRRSFVKKGALASGALALGASGATTAFAQDGGGQRQVVQALMFQQHFFPGSQFRVVSDDLPWTPLETDQLQNTAADLFGGDVEQVFQQYDTRVIQYAFGDPGQYTLLFPISEASVQEDALFAFANQFDPFTPEDVGEDFQPDDDGAFFGGFDEEGADVVGGDDEFFDEDDEFGGGNELGLIQVLFAPVQQQGGGGGGGGGNTTE